MTKFDHPTLKNCQHYLLPSVTLVLGGVEKSFLGLTLDRARRRAIRYYERQLAIERSWRMKMGEGHLEVKFWPKGVNTVEGKFVPRQWTEERHPYRR